MVTRNWRGEVEFRFHHPWAEEVFLVGDFNGWDTAALPMARNEHAEWVCSLRLADGIYEYKYLADGAWHVEDAAEGVEEVPFGANSVLVLNQTNEPAVPVG